MTYPVMPKFSETIAKDKLAIDIRLKFKLLSSCEHVHNTMVMGTPGK